MPQSHLNAPLFLSLRWLIKALCNSLFTLARTLVIEGRENLPRRRMPLIVVCNHAAYVDSVYLACAIRPRITICGAKERYFRTPALRLVAAVGNIMKVSDREGYRADCAALLRAGEVILIYPEMGRNPDGIGPFKTWAAEVAMENGVPLLPCHIAGTGRIRTRPVRIRVGNPIAPVGDAAQLTRDLHAAILTLGSK